MIKVGFKTIPNKLGLVDKFECPKCLNNTNWGLLRVKEYLTIVFIPIIPFGNKYRLICEYCNHEEILSKKHFINYKKKSGIEQAFFDNEITENERNLKINEINRVIEQDKKSKVNNSLEEINECKDLASKKSDEELLTIYYEERYKYIPSMIAAIKNEIEKRELTREKKKNNAIEKN